MKDDSKDAKKQILKDIFLSEEDTLKELGDLVQIAKEFFKVETESLSIVFNLDKEYTVKDKVTFLLISRYFCREAGIVESDKIDLSNISKALSIANTTLSKPLGILIDEGVVKKDEKGNYSVVFHKIKGVLKSKNIKS